MGNGSRWDAMLPPERPGRVAPPEIIEQRAQIMPQIGALHEGWPCLPATECEIEGVRCIQVGDGNADCALLYFHGGGYRLGDPAVWIPFISRIVGQGGVNVILPDYRLAPEHPFPAAVRDAALVYTHLCGNKQGRLFVGGDSAGGGIAAALAVLSSEGGLARPDGLVLISPWLDLTATAESYQRNAERDIIFSQASAQLAADAYLQGKDAFGPIASPLFADPTCYPPVQLFCGTEEVLLEDSSRFTNRLAQHRRSIEAHFVAGMQHVWPMIAPGAPESAALVGNVRRFLGVSEAR